jgi:hypothetical protein
VTPIISRSTLEMDWSSCCSDSLCGLREREERVCLREGEVEASFSLASGLYILVSVGWRRVVVDVVWSGQVGLYFYIKVARMTSP